MIFHSGTAKKNNSIVSNGGRVLSVTALGKDIKEAKIRAYKVVNLIDWPDGYFRKDIGWRAVED